MSQSENETTEQVKTYLPTAQKTEWENHAAELDMSMSEFIRCMVQSGRKPFTVENDQNQDVTPGVDGYKTIILDILSTEPHTWEELEDEILGELSSTLEKELQELIEAGQVTLQPRTGEYKRVEG